MRRVSCILTGLVIVLVLAGCTSFREGIFSKAISLERGLAGMKPGSVKVGEQTIAYLERPGTGETVVLLHGFGADKDNWPRFVRRLPKEYRVIALDLPGHGDSSRLNSETYTIGFITRGMAQAVDALKLTRFHLAGNSMGGYVTMLYSADHPDRVITACLIDAAGIASPEKSDRELALKQGKNILIVSSKKEFDELLDYAFYSRPFLPWPVSSVLAEKAVASNAFNLKMWTDIASTKEGFDFTPRLPEIKAPVLVIWGDHDRITHVSAEKVIRERLPLAQSVVLKDCGHMPMVERPGETAGYYVDFLKKHPDAH
jgi:pimeloyl-ACP methyl ester carboxylesterase